MLKNIFFNPLKFFANKGVISPFLQPSCWPKIGVKGLATRIYTRIVLETMFFIKLTVEVHKSMEAYVKLTCEIKKNVIQGCSYNQVTLLLAKQTLFVGFKFSNFLLNFIFTNSWLISMGSYEVWPTSF
jgi:hypothetical protein